MSLSELIITALSTFAGILLSDFLRYFVAASLVYLLVWQLFVKRLANRKILPDPPVRGQMLREFKHSMMTVLVFASFGMCIFTLFQLGFTKIYEDVATYGWAWFGISLLVISLVHDTWFYWTHRILHQPWWFKRFHAVHHQSIHPTPWAAYSFHPVEAMIQAAFYLVFVVLVPMHPIILFVFLSGMILRNAVGHCAYELIPWRAATRGWLRWLTTNSHHHFHHSHRRGNFGLYFTWWDRLMGTEDIAYLKNGDRLFLRFRPVQAKAHAEADEDQTV